MKRSSKTEHFNLMRKSIISHFVFRRQPAEFFFSKKNRKMRAGQNNRYDITKISSLVQV
jgi:hypothetical protein